jgi:hypothetical protein
MAYASTTHVEALNLGRQSLASVRPGEATAGQVAEWLEETAGILDGLLREKGYVTPVPTTAPTSVLKTLEGFNAIGAAFYVERAAKKSDRLKEAQKMWESAQKMIGDGVVELDLPIDAEETRPRGGFGRVTTAATPYFTRDMVL